MGPVGGRDKGGNQPRSKYEAGALVITAGAWTETLTPSLAHLAIPERQVLGWFQPLRPEWFTLGNFPVTTLAVDEGHYYALPVYGIPGFKIGRYHHLEETSAADNLDRVCRDEDEEILRLGVSRYFPDANGPVLSMKVCMFTNTPDEHFIIDAVPGAHQTSSSRPDFRVTDSSFAAWSGRSWPTWRRWAKPPTTFRC